jgi:SPP1 family predicted phage head-tail adaptor
MPDPHRAIGQHKHRVETQQAEETQTETGDPERTWKTQATVWAKVEPLSSREQFDARRVDMKTTHRVTIRYYAGLKPDDRVRIKDGRVLNIDGIRDLQERERWTELTCQEISDGA